MFQFEVRETIAILINILTAIVVIVVVGGLLGLNTKVGATQTERYIAEERLNVKYEYSACDTKSITSTEMKAYIADYIKNGLTIYIGIDSNQNSRLDSGETYYAWGSKDYFTNRKQWDFDEIGKAIPSAIEQIHNSTVGAPPADLIVQEIGEHSTVRYIAKLIYEDNDPVKQDAGKASIYRSATVTGVLFLKSTDTGLANLYK